MKICVSIDSESYTTLYTDRVNSVEEAVTILQKREGCPLALRIEEGEKSTRITLENGDDYFVVAQVFDIPDERYATIWWHAYDGVDFKVVSTGSSLAEVKEQFDSYIEENWTKEGFEAEDYEDGDTFAIIDTNNEWECLEIVDFAETKILVIENPFVGQEVA